MRRIILSIGIALLLLAEFGCSTGFNSPSVPEIKTANQKVQDGTASKQLWGFWDISLDCENATAEIVPLRGAELTVDVVKFLQPPAGKIANLGIKITDLTNYPTEGRITVEVTLRHPFPGLDMYTGFDVFGVFIHKGGLVFDQGSNTMNVTDGSDSAILENPDGYTCWMSPILFPTDGTFFTFIPGMLGNENFPGPDGADANGYKYFAHGIAKDENVGGFFHEETNFENRGLFSTTSPVTREYKLKFPMPSGNPVIEFQYAVIANWVQPDEALSGDPDVLEIPGDFPPSANAREPIYISVTNNSTLWYVDDANRGGAIDLDLEIFDWSGLAGIGDINISSQNDMIPGDSAVFNPASLVWSDGAFNSSVATIEIPDCTPSALDDQVILIAVESAPTTGYDQGFGSAFPDNLVLSAYLRYQIPVSDEPPVSNLKADGTAEIEPYFDGFRPAGTSDDPIPTEWWLTLDASGSTGTIDEYLWEMNGDDLFDDASGEIVSAGFPDAGTHVIKLKVTDGMGGEDIYELPGSYEVVAGTYAWAGYSGSTITGSRSEPYKTILDAVSAAGNNGYILVRGDNGSGGQCVYTVDLLLTDSFTGTRIQGFYGDYATDKPPMQTGYVRIEGDNITFDGFEVTGPTNSFYMPYGHYSKLGSDNAVNAQYRHLFIHDIGGNCKAILAWQGGNLLCTNIFEKDLKCMFQKNQIHYGNPNLKFLNCTFDRLETSSYGWGLYASGGTVNVVNCIWTDIGAGANTYYLRSAIASPAFNVSYNCTFDTTTPPDGGTYYSETGGNPITLGTGVIYVDPKYVNPYSDHHLQSGSLCIDTGDPSIQDFDGTASDYGCYGGPLGDWDFEN